MVSFISYSSCKPSPCERKEREEDKEREREEAGEIKNAFRLCDLYNDYIKA